VLLLPEDGAPTVFQQGESYTLSESPDEEDLWPDAPTSEHAQATISMDSGEETPSTESTAPSDGSVGRSIRVVTASRRSQRCTSEKLREPRCQRKRCFRRTRPGLTSTILGDKCEWFVRKLANVVEYENDRVRDGDDLVTVYTGVDLTPAGSQFLE